MNRTERMRDIQDHVYIFIKDLSFYYVKTINIYLRMLLVLHRLCYPCLIKDLIYSLSLFKLTWQWVSQFVYPKPCCIYICICLISMSIPTSNCVSKVKSISWIVLETVCNFHLNKNIWHFIMSCKAFTLTELYLGVFH